MNDIHILISSDCLLDKDIGLLKLVEFYYRKGDMFLDNVLDNMVLEIQQYLEYTRDKYNPMIVFTKKEFWGAFTDSLYDQFIEYDYDRICELSCNTLLFITVSLMLKSNSDNKIDILCESEKEQDVIFDRLGKIPSTKLDFIIQSDWSKVDIGKYTDIYVKYVQDLSRFKVLDKKTLYISDHNLNLLDKEQNILIPDALNYMADNIVNTFSFYNFNNIEDDDEDKIKEDN